MNQNSSEFELQLSFIRTNNKDKLLRLMQILDYVDFNHVVIFVRSPELCMELENYLIDEDFQAIGIHNKLTREESLERNRMLRESKMAKKALPKSTPDNSNFGGDNLNIILNYDVPEESQAFLQQLAGAFKLGSKCLSIAFITNESEIKVLREVQGFLKVKVEEITPLIP